ncbi:MAG: Fe-S protein assembly co-chaperone HscB [Phycisphaerales bacterium]|nr:Fe-S protein assembly co-chaperone HscB [Phycisphaerales bacterium]
MDNYFELYQIPISLKPDAALVKQQFYKLSKQYHPDRIAQGDESAQAAALHMAATINDAYQTLCDEDKTMPYLLRLKGLLQDEEKYNLPSDFLMEMMNLNEAVSDYEDAPENESLKQQAEEAIQAQMTAWNQAMQPLALAFEQAEDKTAVLLQIKDFYFRKKYLLRIRERLTTFASR